MARDAVLTLLREDATLAGLGGTGFVVVPNHEADQIPNTRGAFIVIVWGETEFAEEILDNGPSDFDLYVHIPVAVSTDYVRIDKLIDRCDEILRAVEETNGGVTGGDDRCLTFVGLAGRGPDVTDTTYKTICRRASYMALSHKVIA